MDKLSASRVTPVIRQSNKQAARGWKGKALNSTVDALLGAAERLRGEVETETIYWGQVMGLMGEEKKAEPEMKKSASWAVCRVPGERGTLGVRFGSSEASPAFKNRSLGALRRNEDGSIILDQGLANSEPQILRVRIQDNLTGKIPGTSNVPRPVAEGAPIESLILEARNTIFAQELWLELNREARTLGAYGVRAKDNTLSLPLSPRETILLDLVRLGSGDEGGEGEDDELAEGISVAFYLFLTLAHRHSHRKRSQVPAPKGTEKSASSAPVYNLMRPFLTRIKHQETISQTHALLDPLCRALKHALPTALPESSYKVTTTISDRMSDLPRPEQVLMKATYNLEATTELTICEGLWMKITARTQMGQIGSFYTVQACPMLDAVCPPPQGNKPFATFAALREYVFYATSCGLADVMVVKKYGWHRTSQPNVVKFIHPSNEGKHLAVYVRTVELPDTQVVAKIGAAWQWAGDDVAALKDETKIKELLKDSPEIAKKKVVKELEEGVYEWTSTKLMVDDDVQEVKLSLEEVLDVAAREKRE